MATKKTTKATSPAKSDPNAFEVVKSEDTKSQALAKLTTTSSLAAVTLKRYSGAGDEMDVADLLTEMRKAAGVAIRARDAQLPGDFTTMLQRCDGFTEGTR